MLAFDARSNRALTVDYRAVVETGITAQACYEAHPFAFFTYPEPTSGSTGTAGSTSTVAIDYETTPGTCTVILHSLNLVAINGETAELLGTLELDEGERIGAATVTDERAFVQLVGDYYYGYYGYAGVAVDCFGPCYGFAPFGNRTTTVITVAGLAAGDFETGRLDIDAGDWWSYTPIVASGSRAALSTGFRGELAVIDGSDATDPQIVRTLPTSGYVQQLSVVDSTAIAALGYDGVLTLPLED